MAKKGNQSYSSSASIYRQRGRQYDTSKNQNVFNQLNARQRDTQSATMSYSASYKINNYTGGGRLDDETPSLTSNRGYAVWSHIDDETPEDKAHARSFIKLQEISAAGVALVGTLGWAGGLFNTTEATALIATGGGNVARNEGWWQSVQHLPQNLGKIMAYPALKSAETMYNIAYALPDKKEGMTKKERKATKPDIYERTQKWLIHKGRKTERIAELKKAAIEKIAAHPVGKDILETKISAFFLGLGAAVHIPQAKMGWDIYQTTGDMNGHLSGAVVAGVSYAAMSALTLSEVPRLREIYNRTKNNVNMSWLHDDRHMTIGHNANGRYVMDTLSMLPLAGFTYKGLAYMGETLHIYDWTALAKDPASLADSKIVAALSDPTWQGMFDAVTTTDYSNAMLATASLAMLGLGAAFAKSGIGEFNHQHGEKVKYLNRVLFKNPINNAAYDLCRTFETNIIDNAPLDYIKNRWYLDIGPKLGASLPEWVVNTPYKDRKEFEAREEATIALSPNKCILINPSDFLDNKSSDIRSKFSNESAPSEETTIHMDQDNNEPLKTPPTQENEPT